MATLVSIDVINKTIPSLNHENIPIINKPNPCYGYMANAKEVKQLIQMPNYWIYEAGTKIVISGNNYYDYFPEESGIPESVSKEEIQKMIDDSVPEVDSVISTTSTNAIQNSAITNFVNSSVSTNTANYIGLFNSVEELNAYTGTVTNNDYAFVVGEDESGNTKYDRYKWTEETSGWLMEYTLNNSSFTSEEWAAIQSGVKSQDVEQIKKNEEDISNLSTNKADKTELVGKNVTGTKYTINGTEYTAGSNAEIFNDYTNNKAIGSQSHAEGLNTTASGLRSHAEGYNTTASRANSHAEGMATTASGENSHAEGDSTKSTGVSSHAEGLNTTASGEKSHAEGDSTVASGYLSHAEGYNTTASGLRSHAEGYYTKASSDNQHVQGKYNVEDSSGKYAFIIGNGTSDTERSNAFAIDWEGKIWQGNSSIGVQVSQNVDLTLEEYEALSDEEKNNGTYYNIIES